MKKAEFYRRITQLLIEYIYENSDSKIIKHDIITIEEYIIDSTKKNITDDVALEEIINLIKERNKNQNKGGQEMSVHSEINPEKAKKLEEHEGHDIVINDYPQEEEVTVECETCYEILLSFFKTNPNK